MKNTNVESIIKGIDEITAGFNLIKSALAGEEIKSEVAVEKKVEKKAPMNEPEETAPIVAGELDEEQLRSMKYNDFKKLAASLGVDCKGTRDEIMSRVLALNNSNDVQDESEAEEEPVEEKEETKAVKKSKSSKVSGSKKISKKQDEEPAEDEFDKQAKEIAENTAVEDIIDALASVDIKATKKTAVTKLAGALREGLIELDDEDEENETEQEETSADTEDEISSESYFAQYDPEGFNNPENMTDERKSAVEELVGEIIDSYSEEELSDEDIASYVEDNATQDEIDLLGDDYSEEDIFKLYIELMKRTIDDDGESHEPSDPYEVNEENFCCGHKLKYSKGTKKFICECCGEEYETED